MVAERLRPLQDALRAAAVVGALIGPAQAQSPDAQHDYSYERAMQRPSLRAILRELRLPRRHLKAEAPLLKLESQDMARSWERLFARFRVDIDKPYETGGVHAGSFTAGLAIGRLGDGGKGDSFIVDEKLLAPIVAYLKSLHATRPAAEEFDICIVHTHPRRIGGVPLSRIESLPPSAADLKEVLDAGLPGEIDELVGRKVRYREAVVDAKGMWIFERSAQPASVDLTMETARRIHDAQLAWARFVLTRTARTATQLADTQQFRELVSVYASFGVSLTYVDHAVAARMPLCRAVGH